MIIILVVLLVVITAFIGYYYYLGNVFCDPWGPVVANTFLAGCAERTKSDICPSKGVDMEAAKKMCEENPLCNGITFQDGRWTLRKGSTLMDYPPQPNNIEYELKSLQFNRKCHDAI